LVLLSILCIPELNELLIRVLFTEREDMSSGRFEIWKEALSLISDKLFLGWGERPLFVASHGLKEVRAHNSFLELAVTYGIPYTILTYLVWIGFFWPRKVLFNSWGLIQNKSTFVGFCRILFWLVLIKSLITTTFWTNMGDPAVHFVMLVLLAHGLGAQKNTSSAQTKTTHLVG
nr:O-antigen ligase family protein [Bacteroidales bacterium]